MHHSQQLGYMTCLSPSKPGRAHNAVVEFASEGSPNCPRGGLNALGWAIVVLDLLFALAYGYFLFVKPVAAVGK